MATYLIAYDLSQPGRNYPALARALTGAGARRVLESTWLLTHSADIGAVRDYVLDAGQMDANDYLLVFELTGACAWHNPRIPEPELRARLAGRL